ncbi:hypothetical protein JZ751_013563 [Albula glossodonta]|uniref:TXNDC16 N-terminal domain-containing protein n=1 Tax=Albula glossodonta TaxID=121402 RepID=A0A8T2MRC5_9TELE|nr:hypothetical protein JZ751_013563 [Albula glossodonta]
MAWAYFILFIQCILVNQSAAVETSKLMEHSTASFFESLHSGKTSFVYFGNEVNPTIALFLEHLEKSADALEDYGISVAKLQCGNNVHLLSGLPLSFHGRLCLDT